MPPDTTYMRESIIKYPCGQMHPAAPSEKNYQHGKHSHTPCRTDANHRYGRPPFRHTPNATPGCLPQANCNAQQQPDRFLYSSNLPHRNAIHEYASRDSKTGQYYPMQCFEDYKQSYHCRFPKHYHSEPAESDDFSHGMSFRSNSVQTHFSTRDARCGHPDNYIQVKTDSPSQAQPNHTNDKCPEFLYWESVPAFPTPTTKSRFPQRNKSNDGTNKPTNLYAPPYPKTN